MLGSKSALLKVSVVAIALVVSMGVAGASGHLDVEFNDQTLGEDGDVEVSVNEDALDEGNWLVLTYEDGNDTVVAGFEELGDETSLSVEVEDDGGFPGTHTAHVVSSLSGEYEAGDTVSDDTVENVLVNAEAEVVDQEPEVSFEDQALADDGTVTAELNIAALEEGEFVVLTYEDDSVAGDPWTVVAGFEEIDDDGEVSVEVEDDSGFPGEHVAHVVSELSGEYEAGDRVSDATVGNVVVNQAADVTQEEPEEDEPDEDEVETAVTFDDQTSDGDSVVVAESSHDDGYVIVVHEDDGGEAGDAIGGSGDLAEGVNDDVTVELDEMLDEGEHTLYAMLHETDEEDDWGPSLSVDDETVVDSAQVTVEEENDDDDDMDDGMDDMDDDMDDDDDDDDDDEGEGLPGFTVAAAVAALLGVALIAARRDE